jgi:ABC-2 type transport system ATP-binding protein
MTSAVETVDLTRRFKRTEAVDRLTLRVPSGSIFALIGPNGAGKTTTLKLLINLLRPTRGTAEVLGVDSRRLGTRELQRIGYVSENQRLPDWMTLGQLLDYCRPFYPTWDDGLRKTLQAKLGLTAKTALRTLSRGTRMKAALLSSLAYRPELIVLDEPFTGLDPLVRDELVRALLEAADGRPRTVLVSSHDIEEVERLADWVGFLDRGRLLFAEPVSSLLARFQLIEVVASNGLPSQALTDPRWIAQGSAGRTLRFVDTNHSSPDALARIAAAFPSAEIQTFPMPLREIFVTLAAKSAREGAEQ